MIRDGKYNYDSVRRWTKKVDVFALDKVCKVLNALLYSTCSFTVRTLQSYVLFVRTVYNCVIAVITKKSIFTFYSVDADH
jgi:hypothetical protein